MIMKIPTDLHTQRRGDDVLAEIIKWIKLRPSNE